jgi:hypothetical protein
MTMGIECPVSSALPSLTSSLRSSLYFPVRLLSPPVFHSWSFTNMSDNHIGIYVISNGTAPVIAE